MKIALAREHCKTLEDVIAQARVVAGSGAATTTHLARGRYHATPIYDVLSAHPVIGKGKNKIPLQKAKLALAVRRSANYYLIEKIQRRH